MPFINIIRQSACCFLILNPLYCQRWTAKNAWCHCFYYFLSFIIPAPTQTSYIRFIYLFVCRGDLWQLKSMAERVTFLPSANLMGVITGDWHMGKLCFRRKPSGIMFAGKPSHLQCTTRTVYMQGNAALRQTVFSAQRLTTPVSAFAYSWSSLTKTLQIRPN